MKSRLNIAITTFCLSGLLILLQHVVCCSSQQFTVPNYEHGVVICVKGGAMMTINTGHYNDQQALQLFQKMQECKE